FSELVAQSGRSVTGAVLHQDFPFHLLVERMQPQREADRLPLFEVVFVLEKAILAGQEALASFALGIAGGRLRVGALDLESVGRGPRRVAFDLSLHAAELEGELLLVLEYRSDLFDETTVRRMLGNLHALLGAAVADPGARVAALPLLTEAERAQLLRWNATTRALPGPELLHEIIAEQAARHPDAEAVVFAGRSLSYRELDEEANRWARFLRSRGVGPECLVGVCLDRSLEQIVGLCAVLKAGGAYVPLDPEHPAERLGFVLEDTAAPLVLTQGSLAGRLPAGAVRVMVWEEVQPLVAQQSAAPLDLAMSRDHLAYVIYTSDSTGRPKGAMLSHGSVRNRLLWGLEEQLGAGRKRVLYKAPLAFDVSVWEIFAPLLHGSTLVVTRPGAQGDSAYLAELMREQGVTHADFVPSLLQVFLDELRARGLSLPALERITCAGEALTNDLLERCRELLPACEVLNLYGPTEASLAVTYWHCEPGSARQPVPIGRPMWNACIHVLDRGWEPVPAGVPGEVCIGGVAPGRGYWRRPDLTADRFVPDGWGGEPGSRVYRSGDLGRWMADGTLEFLGRIDHQVKIRGFRIELGEIEAALLAHDGVRGAVVQAHDDGAHGPRLVAYVVGNGSLPEPQELRGHLRGLLPEYMVPAAFVVLPDLPLTHSGKVDRAALPKPDLRSRAYVPPRNPVEQALTDIWTEVLGVDRVGVEDDFFALGGHSLLAPRLLARIEESLHVALPLRSVFESPTPAGLAETVLALQWAARGAAPPGEPLSGFEEGEL
ncbi:MAG: non-ribosomal peptide synthetase, partial [Thermoanaerobaculia bacterium]